MSRGSKLYLVLDTAVVGYQRLLKVAKEAMNAGVDVIQLRDKRGSAENILKFAREMRKINRRRVPFIINDRVDLAVAARADGVHLGQDDLPIAVARSILGKKMMIGISCQTLTQAKEAQRQGADYIGFGSVFKTKTKPDRKSMDLKLLAKVTREIKIPVFAIGGISKETLPLLRSIAFEGAAVTRAVCLAKNVSTAVRELKQGLAAL